MLTLTPAAAEILFILWVQVKQIRDGIADIPDGVHGPRKPTRVCTLMHAFRPMMCTCRVYLHCVFALNVPFCFQSTMSQPKEVSPQIYGYAQADLKLAKATLQALAYACPVQGLPS